MPEPDVVLESADELRRRFFPSAERERDDDPHEAVADLAAKALDAARHELIGAGAVAKEQ